MINKFLSIDLFLVKVKCRLPKQKPLRAELIINQLNSNMISSSDNDPGHIGGMRVPSPPHQPYTQILKTWLLKSRRSDCPVEWTLCYNLDLWKILKLLFLLLLCVLILSQLERSPYFHIRFHSSSSISIASFIRRLVIKTFCHCKYLSRRIVYSSGHHGTLNPMTGTPHTVFNMPSWRSMSSVIVYQKSGVAFSLSFATSTQISLTRSN